MKLHSIFLACLATFALSAANAATYSYKQYAKDLRSASCSIPDSLGGGKLPDGGSVTAFAESFVAFGSPCVSEQRTCSKGTLSGSLTLSSCQSNPSTTTWDPLNRWQHANARLSRADGDNRLPLSPNMLTIGEGGYSDQTPYAYSTATHSTGKWYFEYYVAEALYKDLGLGIGTGVPTGFNLAVFNGGHLGGVFTGTATGVGAFTYEAGARLMMAVDLDTGKIWAGMNCSWSSGDPATGVAPNATIPLGTPIKAMWRADSRWANGYHNQVTANFGGSAFGCTVPQGFTAGF